MCQLVLLYNIITEYTNRYSPAASRGETYYICRSQYVKKEF